MEFFQQCIAILATIVSVMGGGVGMWGIVNLLEGYGGDNPASKSQGIKQLIAGGGIVLVGMKVIPMLATMFG